MKSSHGFAWYELLIVIALLGILIALFFPSGHSPSAAKKAHAKNDCVQIATAVTAFETEYGQLPSTNSAVQDVGGPFLQALMGSNKALNPNGIVFLEVPTARKNKSGLRNGVFVDPWGSPYKIKFDTDSDNKIQNVGPSQNLIPQVDRKVAVWTDPDSHADRPAEKTKQRRAVTSWE